MYAYIHLHSIPKRFGVWVACCNRVSVYLLAVSRLWLLVENEGAKKKKETTLLLRMIWGHYRDWGSAFEDCFEV